MINAADRNIFPDGTDHTDKILALIHEVQAQQRIHFPWGTYNVSLPIVANANWLTGVHSWKDHNGTIFRATDDFVGEAVLYAENNPLMFTGLNIHANGVRYGLHLSHVHRPETELARVSVSGASDAGFHFDQCQSFFPRQLHATQCADGFQLSGCNASVVYASRAILNTRSGYVMSGGNPSGGATFRDCVSESNDLHGIELIGANGLKLLSPTVDNCKLENNGADGIIAIDTVSATITNNRIVSKNHGTIPDTSGVHGICLTRSMSAVVQHNQVGLGVGASTSYLNIPDTDGTGNLISPNKQMTPLASVSLKVERLVLSDE